MSDLTKRTGEQRNCQKTGCEKTIYLEPYMITLGRKKFCSKSCLYASGIQTKTFQNGHADLVPKERRGHSSETKLKISLGGKGKHSGKNAWNYKEDRNLLIKSDKKHLDGQYREWMKAVKNRDGWKCKISNGDCSGRLESHHILGWKDYPELRYQINNGITLCVFHHPRKRSEEARLSPYFQSLVEVKAH